MKPMPPVRKIFRRGEGLLTKECRSTAALYDACKMRSSGGRRSETSPASNSTFGGVGLLGLGLAVFDSQIIGDGERAGDAFGLNLHELPVHLVEHRAFERYVAVLDDD